MLKELLNKDAVILNLKATTKAAALKEIAAHLEAKKFIKSKDEYLKALQAREKEFSTGIGDEIAIPHAQNKTVLKNVVLVARTKTPIDWKSVDGQKVKYIFSIALNDKDADKQVDTLQALSGAFMNPQSKVNLEKAKTEADLLNALEAKKATVAKVAKGAKKIVAITACPTGIAHTYMSADKINAAAEEMGYAIKVETQGRKTDNRLTQEDIDNADGIILAIDKGIDGMGRFNGKTVLKVGTKAAIKDSKALIERALKGEGEVIKAANDSSEAASGDYEWGAFKNVYKNLMGGVSRMLPFVIAGGIMLGIAFLIDTGNAGGNLGATRDTAAWFAGLGKVAFGIFVPILGSYVAYSIVGAEGLMPGMVAGLIASGGGLLYAGDIIANNMSGGHDVVSWVPDAITKGGHFVKAAGHGAGHTVTHLVQTYNGQNMWNDMWGRLTPGIDQSVLSAGSGFIGAMVGGYLAAASVTVLRRYVFAKVNKTFRGVVDIVAMPVFSILLTGVAMFVFQIPLAYFAYALKLGLNGLQSTGQIWVLTMILGLMMAVDMGGPVNKVAYVFATANLGTGTDAAQEAMGGVMAAGMVPPLAIAFSTLVFKGKAWSDTERESAKANWLLGMFFITEGAIPFAAKDPKRVIPTMMLGTAITGALMGALQVGVNAPHGGIIVAALYKSYLFSGTGMQIGMGITFLLLSLIAGMVTGGLALGFWRAAAVKKQKLVLA